MVAIILLLIALSFAFIYTLTGRRKSSFQKIGETVLASLLFFNIGIMGLIAFFFHVFQADKTAQMIGWPTGSPFQFEMGMTNLAVGVLGILSFWIRDKFWLATILAVSIIYIGCFIGHLIQYSLGNTAPYNIGLVIWINDLFIPILLILLYFGLKGRQLIFRNSHRS